MHKTVEFGRRAESKTIEFMCGLKLKV